jgi:hypothetical protein
MWLRSIGWFEGTATLRVKRDPVKAFWISKAYFKPDPFLLLLEVSRL